MEGRGRRPGGAFEFLVVLGHSVGWLSLIVGILALVAWALPYARDELLLLRNQVGGAARSLTDTVRQTRNELGPESVRKRVQRYKQ